MIRAGIGGWTFEPWRGTFFPEKLPHAQELAWASRRVSAIEVNGTFYRTQQPSTFARWAEETPDDFVFALKAPRYAVNRRVLAEAGPSIEKFLESGPTVLGDKLGPILWQFAPTRQFDSEDFAAFLALLPRSHDGRTLRHALEVRHRSFVCEAFVAMARQAGAAIVIADSSKHPMVADVTADFVYARLQEAAEDEPAGYAPQALDLWTARARQWAAGDAADGLDLIGPQPPRTGRDVFVFMINGAKVRAPQAAMALLDRLRN